MATLVPQPVINVLTGLLQLIPILNTNFQAINTALNERVVGHRISVARYSATGSTVTKMTLGSVSPPGSVPWAVILVRARETNNPAADLPVLTRVNFSQQGETLYIFEPQGLVQNTFYDLDFIVFE